MLLRALETLSNKPISSTTLERPPMTKIDSSTAANSFSLELFAPLWRHSSTTCPTTRYASGQKGRRASSAAESRRSEINGKICKRPPLEIKVDHEVGPTSCATGATQQEKNCRWLRDLGCGCGGNGVQALQFSGRSAFPRTNHCSMGDLRS